MYKYINFKEAIHCLSLLLLKEGKIVGTSSWQGKSSGDFSTLELINVSFSCLVAPVIPILQEEIRPNLPWVEDHFLERVCGEPLNPGEQYKSWPFYKKDDFRTEPYGQFTHTYMERFWAPARPGIRYPFSNLSDVINLLARDPLTRQAYFPIWFPEDTGAVHGGRVPCTLGYYFLMRDNKLHMFYDIRSCDLLRHFQDDIYLACRLLIWVIERLEERDSSWSSILPGDLIMHVYSFHVFEKDIPVLRYRLEKGMI